MDAPSVLLLVDSLPAPHDPDPLYRIKNSFVYDIMKTVAGSHDVFHPLFVPFCPSIIKALYRMRGFELHFPSVRDELQQGIRTATVRYLFFPRQYIGNKAHALAGYLKKRGEEFRVIHCHTIYDLGQVGMELKRKLSLPLVVSVYGSDVNLIFETGEFQPDKAIVEATKKVLIDADAVTCVSSDLAKKVESLGVPENRISWIPNGIDRAFFYYSDKMQERESLGWPQDVKVILFAGNIFESKGIDDLVEAVALLINQSEITADLKVLVAGRLNEYQSQVRDRVKKLHMDGIFEFLGLQSQQRIAGLMRASDVFCLPSWREGWPCVVLEAVACGCPVVATDVGGIPEIVTDDSIGMLCPTRTPEKLANALARAFGREWDREKISRAADPYTYDKLAGKVEEVYCSVAGS
ncbi:MAG: glycosyltransferase [Candidatus Glassbacteria bacterium]|nr:glycosyltransferase [Candidatus Glassbacteria bacterium]